MMNTAIMFVSYECVGVWEQGVRWGDTGVARTMIRLEAGQGFDERMI